MQELKAIIFRDLFHFLSLLSCFFSPSEMVKNGWIRVEKAQRVAKLTTYKMSYMGKQNSPATTWHMHIRTPRYYDKIKKLCTRSNKAKS